MPCTSLDLWIRVGTNSTALNVALKQWTANACAGTAVFTADGATLRCDGYLMVETTTEGCSATAQLIIS